MSERKPRTLADVAGEVKRHQEAKDTALAMEPSLPYVRLHHLWGSPLLSDEDNSCARLTISTDGSPGLALTIDVPDGLGRFAQRVEKDLPAEQLFMLRDFLNHWLPPESCKLPPKLHDEACGR